MLVGKNLLRVNELIKISLHLLGYDVDILVISDMRGLLYVNQLDDILMIKKF